MRWKSYLVRASWACPLKIEGGGGGAGALRLPGLEGGVDDLLGLSRHSTGTMYSVPQEALLDGELSTLTLVPLLRR